MTRKLFLQSYIKTGLIGSIYKPCFSFQAQFPMYFNSLINKIKYRLVVSVRKHYIINLDSDRIMRQLSQCLAIVIIYTRPHSYYNSVLHGVQIYDTTR